MGMRLILLGAAALAAAACSQPTETVIELPPPAPGPAVTSIVQDVDFLRGCWVEKDSYGFTTAMLRLLPQNGPNSATLEGDLEHFNRHEVEWWLHYTASRDGRLFAIDYPKSAELKRMAWRAARPPQDAPTILPPSAHRAVFSLPITRAPKPLEDLPVASVISRAGISSTEWLIAESEGDRLVLFRLREDGFAIGDFDGRRDGCD